MNLKQLNATMYGVRRISVPDMAIRWLRVGIALSAVINMRLKSKRQNMIVFMLKYASSAAFREKTKLSTVIRHMTIQHTANVSLKKKNERASPRPPHGGWGKLKQKEVKIMTKTAKELVEMWNRHAKESGITKEEALEWLYHNEHKQCGTHIRQMQHGGKVEWYRNIAYLDNPHHQAALLNKARRQAN